MMLWITEQHEISYSATWNEISLKTVLIQVTFEFKYSFPSKIRRGKWLPKQTDAYVGPLTKQGLIPS